MLKIEPWGKIHVSPLSSLTFPCLIQPPPLIVLLLVGASILMAEKPLCSRLHSLHNAPFRSWMAYPLSRSGAVHFLQAERS